MSGNSPEQEYQPSSARPWIIPSRPGCILFDIESEREEKSTYMLWAGFALLFFGVLGCEPKHYKHANPLHRDFKMYLLLGTFAGAIGFYWSRAARLWRQVLSGIIVCGLFGKAFHLLYLHGKNTVPQEYFFPSLVALGFLLAGVGGLHVLLSDDYIVIDTVRGRVLLHSQYAFMPRETLLCSTDGIQRVDVEKRVESTKSGKNLYYRVSLMLPHDRVHKTIFEASGGTEVSPTYSHDVEQVVAQAVAIAAACRKRVTYPPSFPAEYRRQPNDID